MPGGDIPRSAPLYKTLAKFRKVTKKRSWSMMLECNLECSTYVVYLCMIVYFVE